MSSAHALDVLAVPPFVHQQRLCVAELMDAHPEVFARCEAGGSWYEFIDSGQSLSAHDRRAVDHALGLVAQMFRTAQVGLSDAPTPGQLFGADPADESVPPDGRAIQLLGSDAMEDPEAVALARSVTLYKQASAAGIIEAGQLPAFIDAVLEEQPENTPLARSTKQAVRRFAALEVAHLLCDAEDTP